MQIALGEQPPLPLAQLDMGASGTERGTTSSLGGAGAGAAGGAAGGGLGTPPAAPDEGAGVVGARGLAKHLLYKIEHICSRFTALPTLPAWEFRMTKLRTGAPIDLPL